MVARPRRRTIRAERLPPEQLALGPGAELDDIIARGSDNPEPAEPFLESRQPRFLLQARTPAPVRR